MTKITVDHLVDQIADTLCEIDVDSLCEIANKVLSANHVSAGKDEHGCDLVEQEYKI